MLLDDEVSECFECGHGFEWGGFVACDCGAFVHLECSMLLRGRSTCLDCADDDALQQMKESHR